MEQRCGLYLVSYHGAYRRVEGSAPTVFER